MASDVSVETGLDLYLVESRLHLLLSLFHPQVDCLELDLAALGVAQADGR